MNTIDKEERLIDAFSTHWIKYVAPAFFYTVFLSVSLLLFLFAGYAAYENELLSNASFLIALFSMVVAHHWFFFRILSEAMVDVIITNRRLIFLQDSLLFQDDMHEVSLERIRAIEALKHGILQNVFRYGSLWFDTGGSSIKSGRIIRLVPHPHSKAKEIMQLMELK